VSREAVELQQVSREAVELQLLAKVALVTMRASFRKPA
jgi:hypothetical protein